MSINITPNIIILCDWLSKIAQKITEISYYRKYSSSCKDPEFWIHPIFRGKKKSYYLIRYSLNIFLPIVHENIRLPDFIGGDTKICDVAIICLVPNQIYIVPLLLYH